MMKRGSKRAAPAPAFDPAPDVGQQSKRVMDAPSFDVHRVESSHQHLMAGPPLHPQRAESAHQHVRALNSQFASWVQVQLQNHPDELWEDGVKDYLSHASHIMEKFKDVVNWLKANSARQHSNSVDASKHNTELRQSNISNGFAKQHTTTSISSLQKSTPQSSGLSFSRTSEFAGSASGQKSLVTVPENNKATFASDFTNGAAKQTTSVSFATFQNSGLQSTGLCSFSQKPAFSGIQSDTTPNVDASGDVNEEDDLEKPSSPSLKKAEEKGIIVVHEAKCKVYVKPDDPADKGWKDMGMGHLSIKCKEGAVKATKDSKPTIVIRNDVGKILLNALIYQGIKINVQKNSIASIFHTTVGHGEGADGKDFVTRTYLLRLKNEEETTKLAAAIKDHAPSD